MEGASPPSWCEVSAASESEFEGEPEAGGTDAGADTSTEPGAGDAAGGGGLGGALSVNALIAANIVLNTATAELVDSEVTILGSLGVEAENVSTIEASNTATTESTGGVAATSGVARVCAGRCA